MTVHRIVFSFAFALCRVFPARPTNTRCSRRIRLRIRSGSDLILDFGPTVSNAEGKQAAKRFLQAMGGAAKVNAVKTLHQTVVAVRRRAAH